MTEKDEIDPVCIRLGNEGSSQQLVSCPFMDIGLFAGSYQVCYFRHYLVNSLWCIHLVSFFDIVYSTNIKRSEWSWLRQH